MIPAHAWTPWFGIFGSKSGFDSLTECFGEMEKYVYGIETGLSSDPVMNWGIKHLDEKSILSFSDAHSLPKLGREATVFVSKNNIKEFTYEDLSKAIKKDSSGNFKIGYTIEFFPEEGKYHWSGHRDCGIKYSPQQVKEKGVICPVCARPLTIGVENRVLDLSYKDFYEDLAFVKSPSDTTFVYDRAKTKTPFVSLIPLLEILLEVNNKSQTKAIIAYEKLTEFFGTEFDILIKKSFEEITQAGGERLATAIKIVRERLSYVDPGFDGVFGTVQIFKGNEKIKSTAVEQKTEQGTLF
jgi:PHP family Zn ribbon phosphoesterase